MTAINPNDWFPVDRHERFKRQSKNAGDRLLNDIGLWLDQAQLAADSSIKFHMGQFNIFCRNSFERSEKEARGSDEDSLFRFKVTGVLTTQWSILRAVANQRVNGNPYSKVTAELDQEAARYYRIASRAISGENTAGYVPRSTPLVYLGRAADLVFFNNENQLPPAIIRVPFGVVADDPNSRSRLSLAHEVGHAIFQRLTPFQEEAEKAFEDFAQAGSTRQDRVVRKIIAAWRNEIVADEVGLALVGPAFVDSALDVLAGPPEHVGVSDDTHPPPIIRPYIYLSFLEHIKRSDRAELLQPYIENLNQVEAKINEFAAPSLDRRFEALPALTRVSLGEVAKHLRAVTALFLDQPFTSLGKTFGDYLIECAVSANEPSAGKRGVVNLEERQAWGEQLQVNEERFVLDLSNLAPPSFSVPISFRDVLCRIFGVGC